MDSWTEGGETPRGCKVEHDNGEWQLSADADDRVNCKMICFDFTNPL